MAAGMMGIEAFNKPGVVIAARLGSTAVTATKKYLPKAEIRMFDDEAQAYQEVINNRVHAVVGSAPTPAFQAIKYPDKLFSAHRGHLYPRTHRFCRAQGRCGHLNYFNNWIGYVEAEGWLKDRKSYWFETKDWESQIQ
jgi:polar amino acid transport system substrate-binding protein